MASKVRLESLPSEIIQHLLCFIPDVTSLWSTILTCSSLYNAFINAEALITSHVVKNFIDVDVLPEAVAALKSSRLAPFKRDRVLEFVQSQLVSRKSPQISWILPEALPLSNLHQAVEYFAASFALRTLARLSPSAFAGTLPEYPLSPEELYRIQRALYRFEIYCNLFRGRKSGALDINEQQEVFFSKFSPWENEQLGCVHDYLFHLISPGMFLGICSPISALTVTAFNDIVHHDVAWGALFVEDAFDLDSGYIQRLLSRGLVYLAAIATAETYDERYQVLYEPYPKSGPEDFLYKGLGLSNGPDDGVELSEYTEDEEEDFARLHQPFVHESNTGPFQAWRWAHQHETNATFIYADSQRSLREQGYVFWDQSRLEAWPLFQRPWEPPDSSAADNERASHRASLNLWDRTTRRSQIYDHGGRGWWSPDDESKVVYPSGKAAPPKWNRGLGKTSQQAADELLHKLASGPIPGPLTWQTWEPKIPIRRR